MQAAYLYDEGGSLLGEIVSGHGFGPHPIFAKFKIVPGTQDWNLLRGHSEGQTQISAPDPRTGSKNEAAWVHPIDAHFEAGGLCGWPKLFVEVFKEDEYGRHVLAGYGTCWIPPSTGEKNFTIGTWVPEGTGWEKLASTFLGAPPQLEDPSTVYDGGVDRYNFRTKTSGFVTIRLNTIAKGFAEAGIELG